MIYRALKNTLLVAVLLSVCRISGYAQDTECKVLMPSISIIYTGECRKGLAHGYGSAEGIDRYTGTFRSGLPHGKGVYYWTDGSVYEGQFENGLKNGAGKMITADSTYTGIWKNDVYAGIEILPSYTISRSYNITRSSFFKSKSNSEVIRIRFFQGANEYKGIRSVDIAHNSGEPFHDGYIHGIQRPSFPVEIRISFTADNTFGTSQFNANLDFIINEPGAWDVRISY
ncbi:MAG: hypothetical protein V1903_01390 [Bacteroidota bacterium]